HGLGRGSRRGRAGEVGLGLDDLEQDPPRRELEEPAGEQVGGERPPVGGGERGWVRSHRRVRVEGPRPDRAAQVGTAGRRSGRRGRRWNASAAAGERGGTPRERPECSTEVESNRAFTTRVTLGTSEFLEVHTR